MFTKIKQIITGMEPAPEEAVVTDLAEITARCAVELFIKRQLCCSESVIYVINRALRGDLSPEQAVRLGSGFCHGMGGGDGVCGALSGAVMAMGLFLGRANPGAGKPKKFDRAIKDLHDQFSREFGSTSCRTLCTPFAHDRQARKRNCAMMTSRATELTIRALLAMRPDLAKRADTAPAASHDAT